MKTKFEWKLKKPQLLTMLLAGVLLVVAAMPVKKPEKEEMCLEAEEAAVKERDAEAVERKLEKILREVEGVGKVKVMVTFQSSSEKIVEKDQEENSETTVYSNASGGGQTPYVRKELNPKVEGIVVIAEGGENAVVIKNITEAVQALFDVDTHKIKVMKRNQTN